MTKSGDFVCDRWKAGEALHTIRSQSQDRVLQRSGTEWAAWAETETGPGT